MSETEQQKKQKPTLVLIATASPDLGRQIARNLAQWMGEAKTKAKLPQQNFNDEALNNHVIDIETLNQAVFADKGFLIVSSYNPTNPDHVAKLNALDEQAHPLTTLAVISDFALKNDTLIAAYDGFSQSRPSQAYDDILAQIKYEVIAARNKDTRGPILEFEDDGVTVKRFSLFECEGFAPR